MLKKITIWVGVLCAIGFVGLIGFDVYLASISPEIDPYNLTDRTVEIFNESDHSVKNYRINDNPERKLVEIGDIPDYLKYATLVVTDRDFYETNNCSVFKQLLFCRKSPCKYQSTSITGQIVKNVYLERGQLDWEVFLYLPCRIEKKLSKDEILQVYFNEMPYSLDSYGVQAASREFFHKNINELNLAESAILAALPMAPTLYSPYGENKSLLIERQHDILDLMVKYGYVTSSEANAAKNYNVVFFQD